MPIDPAEELKARRLSRLREELGYLMEDEEPRSCAWRQGMLEGRMLELKELGIVDQEDVNAFLDELTAVLWSKKLAKDRQQDT